MFVIRYHLFAMFLCGCFFIIPEAHADMPAPVSSRIAQSVVRVQNGSDAGTGVIVSPDGLVLTNHHLIVGAFDLKVVAPANRRGLEATVITYDDIEVISAHPEYDVALIKINKDKARFRHINPAVGIELKQDAEYYIVSFAGSNYDDPEIQITKKKTSALNSLPDEGFKSKGQPHHRLHSMERNWLISGPLFDKRGMLVGFISPRKSVVENYAYAVPASAFNRRVFIEPSKIQPDENVVADYHNRLQQLSGLCETWQEKFDESTHVQQACRIALVATALDPTNPALLADAAMMLHKVGDHDLAVEYARRAEVIDPEFAKSYLVLGLCAEAKDDTEVATLQWRNGLVKSDENTPDRAHCALFLAKQHQWNREWANTAYMTRWAQSISVDSDLNKEASALLVMSRKYLSDTQSAYLNDVDDFSLDDAKKFAAIKADSPASLEPTKAQRIAESNAPRYKRIAELLKRPTNIDTSGHLIEFNDDIHSVAPAYSGLYLAVRYAKTERIDVFDAHDGKKMFEIPLRGLDSQIQGAGDHLLVIYPNKKLFERWSMVDGKMVDAKPIKVDDKFLFLKTGIENDKRAVVGLSVHAPNNSTGYQYLDLALFDLESMQRLTPPLPPDGYRRPDHWLENLSVNAACTTAAAPSSRYTFVLSDAGIMQVQPLGEIKERIHGTVGAELIYGKTNLTNFRTGETVEFDPIFTLEHAIHLKTALDDPTKLFVVSAKSILLYDWDNPVPIGAKANPHSKWNDTQLVYASKRANRAVMQNGKRQLWLLPFELCTLKQPPYPAAQIVSKGQYRFASIEHLKDELSIHDDAICIVLIPYRVKLSRNRIGYYGRHTIDKVVQTGHYTPGQTLLATVMIEAPQAPSSAHLIQVETVEEE